MTQLYSTPDGSIWALSEAESKAYGTQHFHRVDSPDDGHEDDFRAQKLDEILRSWGPLSLHDPDKEEHKLLVAVLLGLPWSQDSRDYATTLQKEFRRMGLRLIKEKK